MEPRPRFIHIAVYNPTVAKPRWGLTHVWPPANVSTYIYITTNRYFVPYGDAGMMRMYEPRMRFHVHDRQC